jgi:hypothetical protein
LTLNTATALMYLVAGGIDVGWCLIWVLSQTWPDLAWQKCFAHTLRCSQLIA